MTATLRNPYLSGNFAPIRTELTDEPLTVIGEIPADLNGWFIRNGPNPQFPPIGRYHWFDGDGMLHSVRIQDGKASYRNRYVRTHGYQVEQAAGRALWGGLLEPTPPDNPHGASKNVANTALAWHCDRLLALWEGGAPHEIKVSTLETVGQYTFNGKLKSPVTAHPKVDPLTNEMMILGYSLFQPPYLHYGVVSAEGKLVKTVSIDLPVGVMMHDFAITEDYTIFMDLPLTFRPEKTQRGGIPLAFEADRPSRFGILPRYGDNSMIRWFEAPSCYIFHTLNAYESGDEIVLIGCRKATIELFGNSEGANESDRPGVQDDQPYLYEWRFNLKTGDVKQTQLDDRAGEFPRINESYQGRETRYGYMAKSAPSSMPLFEGYIKYDFKTGSQQVHTLGAGRYGGEGVFAPRPGAIAEDDGWLITYVHDEEHDRSEVVIINANDFTAEPVARILLPQRVPYGFHGIWVAQ